MRRGNNRLSTLSEIYAYFRKNQTPITLLSPTPYNLLGLGRWINKFDHVNYFDSFDGRILRSPSRANTVPMSFDPSRMSTTTSCVTRRCAHT